jgi:hypothetical protein
LEGQLALVKYEGKILCAIKEEPAADVKNADEASMANFPIASPPA